uniref:Anaphase-promoting complex subunit 4-like WD40 domain-containing protein n=2 Tax=Schistocephalus solidus TaxID=70667 RepID=A0A0X3PLJ2_SCHSO
MFSKGRPFRASRLKRGKAGQTVNLERVLGFTAGNNCSVSFDAKTSTLLYTAGCVVVAESCTTGQQSFIQSPSRKLITCLDTSPDGQFLATGEFGHQPKVRLWSRANHGQVAEFSSHHFRVSCVRFCPNSRNLVSVGSQEDQTICVWDRVQLQKIASAKVTAKVNALAFSEDGDFFVTVGIRHVRFWYIDLTKGTKTKETQPLKGRNAVLNDMLNNTFTDVCCVNPFSVHGATGASQQSPEGPNLTLVVSQAGHLIQFNKSRQLTKWVDLKTQRANCLSVNGNTLAVGCASGVCLLFQAFTLGFVASIPLPHVLGADIPFFLKQAPTSCRVDEPRSPRYPDVITVKLDFSERVLVCMYADHSLHCWDLRDLTAISRRFSHFYHSRPVNSVGMAAFCGVAKGVGTAVDADSATTEEASTVRRFATCSDDGTVRIWNFKLNESTLKSTELFPDGKESVAVIYSDQLFTTLCADERISAGFGPSYLGSGSNTPTTPSSPALTHRLPAKWESSTSLANLATDSFSLRSLAVSPDGQHLAVGDKAGGLRIYDLKTSKLLHSIPAHETEILCLSYFQSTSVPEMCLLCSTSRDRVIHVFEPRQSYSLVQTLADHSGSITAARLVENVNTREICLFSCSTDRSILCRTLSADPATQMARFVLLHTIAEPHAYVDAVVVGPSSPSLDSLVNGGSCAPAGAVPRLRHYLAVACQDRRIRIYSVTRGKPVCSYRASPSEDGALICCTVDPTNTFLASAGSDKQINIYHLFSGVLVSTLFGHSELVSGLLFLPDLRHLVSISSDSCIFVWRLATEMTALMVERREICASILLARDSPCLPTRGPGGRWSKMDVTGAGDFAATDRPIRKTGLPLELNGRSPDSESTFVQTSNTQSLYPPGSPGLSSSLCFSDAGLPRWARRSHCPSGSDNDLNSAVFESTTLPRRTATVRLSSARLPSSKPKSHSFRSPATQAKSAIGRSNSESATDRPPLRVPPHSQLSSFTADMSSDDEQIYQSRDSLYQDSSNQDLVSCQPEIEQTKRPAYPAAQLDSRNVISGSSEISAIDAFSKLSTQRPNTLVFVEHQKLRSEVPEETDEQPMTADPCSPSTGFPDTKTSHAMFGTDSAALFHSWTACGLGELDPMSTSSHEFHQPFSEWKDPPGISNVGRSVQRRASAMTFKAPNRASWPDSTYRSSCTSILGASPIIRPHLPLVTRPASETTFLHPLPLRNSLLQTNTSEPSDVRPGRLRSTGSDYEEATKEAVSTVREFGGWSRLSASPQTVNMSSEAAATAAAAAASSRQPLFVEEKISSGSDAVNSGPESSEMSVITPLLKVRTALDAAILELDRVLGACAADHDDDEEGELEQCRLASQKFVEQELERRFCRLRALLGLEPVCMNSVIAKMLIADMAERISSQIRLAIADSLPESKDLARLISELIRLEIQPDSMAVSTDPPLSCLR